LTHSGCNHNYHAHEQSKSKLTIVIILTFIYMLAEFIGGWLTNSLALVADAGHMLSDVAALALSLFAVWLSIKPASSKKTYGYYRTEILAAFINGIALAAIAIFIIYEAYTRIFHPPEIRAPLMIFIAIGGLIINIIAAFLLHAESQKSLNIKGAFLHIIGDLLGSAGTVIAGFVILIWKINLADPIISIIIAILVLISAIGLVNEAINILLEGSPSYINVESIKESLLSLEYVDGVHDLHVWSISSKNIALSVHVVTKNADCEAVLCMVDDMIREKFGINHLTIQIEPVGYHEGICQF